MWLLLKPGLIDKWCDEKLGHNGVVTLPSPWASCYSPSAVPGAVDQTTTAKQ